MGAKETLDYLSKTAGLKVVGTRAFGRVGQHPVSATFPGVAMNMSGSVYAVLQVRVSRENWPTAAARAGDKAGLKALGLKPHEIRLDANTGRIIQAIQPAVRAPKPEAILESLNKMAVLASAGGAPGLGDRCQNCGATPSWVFLLNGTLQQMCKTCYDQLAAKYGNVRAQVNATRPNYGKGLLYGLGAAIVGALLWGVVGGLTGLVSGLIALVIGYLVAYAIQQGAGKVDNLLVVASVFMTLLGITLGGIVWVAVELPRLGVSLNPLDAWFFLITTDPGIFAIDYVFGMIGVIGGAYRLMQTVKQHKVPFEIVG